MLIYVLLVAGLLPYLSHTSDLVLFTQINIFIVFAWVAFAQIRLNGLLHIFTIFLGVFFLFLLSLPFFDLVSLVDISKLYVFRRTHLSNDIFIQVYSYTSLFLLFIFTGVLFGYKNQNQFTNSPEIKHSKLFYTSGIILFVLSMPGLLTKYYLQLKVVLQKGYLAVYDGSLQQLDYPLVCKGAGTLLVLGYCLFLASKPNKKQFLIITTLFLLTQVFNVLKGQRSVLMFPLVFSVWFYFRFYIRKIPSIKIVLLVLGIAVFSQTIHYLRVNDVNKNEDKSFAQRYLISFFEVQGVTFYIFPYMLHYLPENKSYPYILAPLDFRSYGMPQTIDRLQKFNYLPDQLMYRMLPNDYTSGGGVGSSILAVFYDLPKIVGFLLLFLLGFLISKFDAYVKYSRLLILSSYYIVFAITSSVRYEPLQLFYDLVMVWIFYAIIQFFQNRAIRLNQNKYIKNEDVKRD